MAGSRPNLRTMVPRRPQGQDRGQRSRDTDTFVISRKSLILAGGWLDRDQTCTRWSPDGPASGMCSRSRSTSNAIAHMVKQFIKLFAIQYGLTFWLYMRSLYEAPLHSPSSISIRQLDLMSKSWNELLRHWRSSFYILFNWRSPIRMAVHCTDRPSLFVIWQHSAVIGLPDALNLTFKFFPHTLLWNIWPNMSLRWRSSSLWSLGGSRWTSMVSTCRGVTPITSPVMQSRTFSVVLSPNRVVDTDDFGFLAKLWLDSVGTDVVTVLVKGRQTNRPNDKTLIKIPQYVSFSRGTATESKRNTTNTTRSITLNRDE